MSYDCTKWVYCQVKYIVAELLVRTDWEVVGGARVTLCNVTKGDGQSWIPTDLRELSGDGGGAHSSGVDAWDTRRGELCERQVLVSVRSGHTATADVRATNSSGRRAS